MNSSVRMLIIGQVVGATIILVARYFRLIIDNLNSTLISVIIGGLISTSTLVLLDYRKKIYERKMKLNKLEAQLIELVYQFSARVSQANLNELDFKNHQKLTYLIPKEDHFHDIHFEQARMRQDQLTDYNLNYGSMRATIYSKIRELELLSGIDTNLTDLFENIYDFEKIKFADEVVGQTDRLRLKKFVDKKRSEIFDLNKKIDNDTDNFISDLKNMKLSKK